MVVLLSNRIKITLSNPYQIKVKYIPSPHLFQFQTRSLTFLFSHLPIRYCLHLMRYDNILIEIAIFCSKILYYMISIDKVYSSEIKNYPSTTVRYHPHFPESRLHFLLHKIRSLKKLLRDAHHRPSIHMPPRHRFR